MVLASVRLTRPARKPSSLLGTDWKGNTMSNDDYTRLVEHVDATLEDIREYARQIDTGEYDDEPTITDENGNETQISEYALSVEVKLGKPLQVWLSFGGPNILIESTGYQNTRLEGHWGGESVYRSGQEVESVFDYLVADLWDSAPEEYK